MTEAEWLSSTDPTAMLATLRAITIPGQVGFIVPGEVGNLAYYASDRKLRLWAVACCRQAWDGVPCPRCGDSGLWAVPHEGAPTCPDCHGTGRVGGLTDPRSRRAVEVAERFADVEATDAELSIAYADAYEAHLLVISNITALVPPAAQAALLRDIFGDPWRLIHDKSQRPAADTRVRVDELQHGCGVLDDGCSGGVGPAGVSPAIPPRAGVRPGSRGEDCQALRPILTWDDGTVPQIAQAIYDERRWQDMPILGDALTDAGCEDEDILRHCRGLGRCPVTTHRSEATHDALCLCKGTGWLQLVVPHVRGCWVLDLILGKE